MKHHIVLASALNIIAAGCVYAQFTPTTPPPSPLVVDISPGFREIDLNSMPPDAQPFFRPLRPKRDGDQIAESMLASEQLEAYVTNVVKNAEPWESAKGKLAFEPVDLSRSAFASLSLVGAVAGGISTSGGYTSVKRVFHLASGEYVVLYEWDFSITGGGGVFVKDLVNARVGGRPAIKTILTAPNDTAVTRLFWATPDRAFRLMIDRNLARDGRVGLLEAWAESIQ